MAGFDRRNVLIGSAALMAAGLARPEPARAAQSIEQLLAEVFGERRPKSGVIAMKLSPLSENGLSVPITLTVDEAPATVKRIVLLAPENPFPRAAEYRFGPRAGKVEVATRIRLARSQAVTAVAELSDGSLWSTAADITITSGACAEGFDGH